MCGWIRRSSNNSVDKTWIWLPLYAFLTSCSFGESRLGFTCSQNICCCLCFPVTVLRDCGNAGCPVFSPGAKNCGGPLRRQGSVEQRDKLWLDYLSFCKMLVLRIIQYAQISIFENFQVQEIKGKLEMRRYMFGNVLQWFWATDALDREDVNST
jgi:hypothetical protein